MGQPNAFSTESSIDVTISGAQAKAEHGRGASFDNQTPVKLTRQEVEVAWASEFEKAYRHRQQQEAEWINEYQQYHGNLADSGKSEWQSQAHVPRAANAVDTTAARIAKVMLGKSEWFRAIGENTQRDVMCDIAEAMVQRQFDLNRAVDSFAQACKHALICGNGPLKVHVSTEMKTSYRKQFEPNPAASFFGLTVGTGGSYKTVQTQKPLRRMRFEPILPTDYWLDPSGLFRWQVVKSKRNISDLWALSKPLYAADGKTKIRDAVYDPEVVQTIRPGQVDLRLDQQAAIIRRDPIVHLNASQLVDVYEFWGDFPDPTTGAILYHNVVMTFVDKRWCIRMPEVNPFFHGVSPVLLVRGKNQPGQIYGRGLIAQGIKLQFELDRVMQAMIDKTHLSIGMTEVDPSVMRNPEELQGGKIRIAVGKAWQRRRGADPAQKIFSRSDGPEPINEWEPQLYQMLRAEYDASVGNSQFSDGSQPDRTRKTKAEVQIKAMGSEEIYNDAAQYIEGTALGPLVNMVWKLVCQFLPDFNDPGLRDMLQDRPDALQLLDQLTQMPEDDRWQLMRVDTEFKVDGVSIALAQNEMLDAYQNFKALTAQDMLMSQCEDKQFSLYWLRRLLGLPRQILMPEAQQFLQAAKQGLLAQLAAGPRPGGAWGADCRTRDGWAAGCRDQCEQPGDVGGRGRSGDVRRRSVDGRRTGARGRTADGLRPRSRAPNAGAKGQQGRSEVLPTEFQEGASSGRSDRDGRIRPVHPVAVRDRPAD